jgi:FkbM family methyltransferase
VSSSDRERIWAKVAQMRPEFKPIHDIFDDPWAVEALLLGDFMGWEPFSGARVMDVGANVGIFTAFCALHGAHVTAYEPDPITFSFLTQMLKQSDLYSLVTPINSAIWISRGEITYGGGEIEGGRCRCRNGSLFSERIIGPVSAVSFEDAIGGQEWDFVKMDIEGAEFDVLESTSGEALSKIKFLQVEFHNGVAKVGQYERVIEKLEQIFESSGAITKDGPHAGEFAWAHLKRLATS